MTTLPICVRCQQPVKKNASSYGIFEHMHWLCFHLEFEHQGDADQACGDPCPWWHIEVFRRKLVALDVNPDDLMKEAVIERWQL